MVWWDFRSSRTTQAALQSFGTSPQRAIHIFTNMVTIKRCSIYILVNRKELLHYFLSILQWRKRVLPTIIGYNISSIQITEGACEPAFLVGDPLRILFHMPHFAYRFFPFLSYLLWQNDIHGQNRCLKYFVVPNLGYSYICSANHHHEDCPLIIMPVNSSAIDFWRQQSRTAGNLSWPRKVTLRSQTLMLQLFLA